MKTIIKIGLLIGLLIIFIAVGALIQLYFAGQPTTNGDNGINHMSPLIIAVIRGTET